MIDRLTIDSKNNSRLIQSLETCVSESNGLIEIQDMDDEKVLMHFQLKWPALNVALVFRN